MATPSPHEYGQVVAQSHVAVVRQGAASPELAALMKLPDASAASDQFSSLLNIQDARYARLVRERQVSQCTCTVHTTCSCHSLYLSISVSHSLVICHTDSMASTARGDQGFSSCAVISCLVARVGTWTGAGDGPQACH